LPWSVPIAARRAAGDRDRRLPDSMGPGGACGSCRCLRFACRAAGDAVSCPGQAGRPVMTTRFVSSCAGLRLAQAAFSQQAAVVEDRMSDGDVMGVDALQVAEDVVMQRYHLLVLHAYVTVTV